MNLTYINIDGPSNITKEYNEHKSPTLLKNVMILISVGKTNDCMILLEGVYPKACYSQLVKARTIGVCPHFIWA